jgi:hypothetical protein
MQVHTVQILYHGLFKRKSIVHIVLHEYRYRLQTRNTGRTPTTLTGNEFKLTRVTFNGTDNDGLQDAKFFDRRSEGLQTIVIERLAGLKLIWTN